MSFQTELVLEVAKTLSKLVRTGTSLIPTTEDYDTREHQIKLLKQLSELGIDPRLFDLLLSTELDRRLKKKFAFLFLGATVGFTLLSYAVIILNAVYSWGIHHVAITALIIETPIQFIGLLYIIAKNLFPQGTATHVDAKGTPRRGRAEESGKRRDTQKGGRDAKEAGEPEI